MTSTRIFNNLTSFPHHLLLENYQKLPAPPPFPFAWGNVLYGWSLSLHWNSFVRTQPLLNKLKVGKKNTGSPQLAQIETVV